MKDFGYLAIMEQADAARYRAFGTIEHFDGNCNLAREVMIELLKYQGDPPGLPQSLV